MVKRILIILGTVFLVSEVFAQSRNDAAAGVLSLGVNAGWLYDTPVVNTQYAYNRVYSPGSGAVLGVPVQYDFKDWFALFAEPGIQYRNSRYRLAHWYSETRHNLYLDIPVMASFSFGGKSVRGFVNAGGYAGAWLAGWQDKHTDEITGVLESAEGTFRKEMTGEDCRFDAGLVAGAGLRLFSDKNISCVLEYRFYYGLTSSRTMHSSGFSYAAYDNLQTVTLGIRFNNLFKTKSK